MRFEYTQIKGHENVIAVFSSWPSFDDFEVISVFLERDRNIMGAEPRLIVELQASEGDPTSNDPVRASILLKFRFLDPANLKLTGFNHQNALNGIQFDTFWSETLKQERLLVKFLPGFGLSLEFECASVEVVSVSRDSGT